MMIRARKKKMSLTDSNMHKPCQRFASLESARDAKRKRVELPNWEPSADCAIRVYDAQ